MWSTRFRDWIKSLDDGTHARIVAAIDLLAEHGRGSVGRWRSSILLVAGDKAGQWNAWYREAIPLAEQRYETYLKERAKEGGEA